MEHSMNDDFIKIEHADGSVEYVHKDAEAMTAAVDEIAKKAPPIIFTEEQLAESILAHNRHEAMEYLKSTDWYAARLAETGTAIPEEILEKRQAARQLLSS
jgi:hypothetical protein